MRGDVIAGYRLGRSLGRGSTGTVLEARRDHDGAVVAIKLLRGELGDDRRYAERFEREAWIAIDADHPNLVPVLDAGRHSGQLYLVAELMPGGSLRDLVSQGPLTLDEAARVVLQIGTGLEYLHQLGIVHRDVKPSNVVFDAAGTARLTDFGLAKHQASVVLTRTGQVLGTPAYMAPELVEGAEATAASDHYALACTAFECVTGRPPFYRGTIMQIAVDQVCSPPPDPLSLRADISRSMVELLLAGLAKPAADRPPSPVAWGESMVRSATGSPATM